MFFGATELVVMLAAVLVCWCQNLRTHEVQTMSTTTSIQRRIAAFEQAAANAVDPQIMAAKISEKKDRKKYNFVGGLSRDTHCARAALRAVASDDDCCTFGDLFQYTEGRIANLNRVLQNLKRANEIQFEPECFLKSMNDNEQIQLLEPFWKEMYKVSEENIFRPGRSSLNVPQKGRKGRSFVEENVKTMHVYECCACARYVKAEERITIRAQVFHLSCLSCTVCGASPRQKKDYITFDGRVCCSYECFLKYDGAHLRQERYGIESEF